jgi:hypothetical protein
MPNLRIPRPTAQAVAPLTGVELTKTTQTFSSITEGLQYPHDRPAQR